MPFVISPNSNDAHPPIYIGLGANQAYGRSSPLETLNSGLKALVDSSVTVTALSRPWRTPAWPDPAQPPFVNGAARLETDLTASALMQVLHDIESRLGRRRSVRNAPRTLDLDLIDYRGQINEAGQGAPILPHPRAHARAFVLLPLREIAPYWRHPVSKASIQALLAATPLTDRAACRPAGGSLCAAADGLKRNPR